jgi:hypothetical protein
VERDYPAVEYTPPHGHYSMDILTRLGEAFTWQDLAANYDEIELGDLIVQVANPKMLYRMKKDTVRPQDRADAGVRKFRSLAEANRHRQEWEKKQVRSPL